MAAGLDQILEDASQKNLTPNEVILRLLDVEVTYREDRMVQERIRKARLPHLSTIESFDFNFHPSRKKSKAKILGLLDLDFVRDKKDIILLGNPGVGKSYIAECLALAACQAKMRVCFTTVMDMVNVLTAAKKVHNLGKKLWAFRKPELLCADELGYLSLDKQGADLLFQVLSYRSGRSSTVITTNKAFRDWGDIFGSATVAAALADRLVANSEVIILERSFRSKHVMADS
jgi:DNA replication protein DnaC